MKIGGIDFRGLLEKELSQAIKREIRLLKLEQVFGGDINQSFRADTDAGKFFIKLNLHPPGNDFFGKEAQGLGSLAANTSLNIPKVLHCGRIESIQYMILSFLEKGQPTHNFWQVFGAGLAELHRVGSAFFGWDSDNYIGIFPQQNSIQSSAAVFYGRSRLMYPVMEAFNRKLLDPASVRLAEKLSVRLNELIPDEPPSLLHGDLWNGNFLVSADGLPAIFDPSVYYGHRETDLAMTLLFGGFQKGFYESYHSDFPLTSGWQQRIPLFQLYPLLIHLNLFGAQYRSSVIEILKKFS